MNLRHLQFIFIASSSDIRWLKRLSGERSKYGASFFGRKWCVHYALELWFNEVTRNIRSTVIIRNVSRIFICILKKVGKENCEVKINREKVSMLWEPLYLLCECCWENFHPPWHWYINSLKRKQMKEMILIQEIHEWERREKSSFIPETQRRGEHMSRQSRVEVSFLV